MSPHEDLDAQLAQRLLGWVHVPVHPTPWWRLPEGAIRYGAPPAFSTDPAATACVWQWLETRGAPLDRVAFGYHVDGEEGPLICCAIQLGREEGVGYGATWPEALCRAALALADSLDGETLP